MRPEAVHPAYDYVEPASVKGHPCPLLTSTRSTLEESSKGQSAEITAYKLGKKRWSYNKIDLHISNSDGTEVAKLKEGKTLKNTPMQLPDSSVAYSCVMDNGHTILLHAYLVYDAAREVTMLIAPSESKEEEYLSQIPPEDFHRTRQFQWDCVDRHSCNKGCQGPVLVPIKRYPKPRESVTGAPGEAKKPSSIHLSIDEASNHVGIRCFRLLFGAFDADTNDLLGTAITQPIRVFVNNDVPRGSGQMAVNIKVRDDWIGWSKAISAVPSSPQFLHALDDGFASHPQALSSSTPKPATPQLPHKHLTPSTPEEVSNTQASSCLPYGRSKRLSSFTSQPGPKQDIEEALTIGDLAHNQHIYHDDIGLTSEDEGAYGWASDSGEELIERTGHDSPPSYGAHTPEQASNGNAFTGLFEHVLLTSMDHADPAKEHNVRQYLSPEERTSSDEDAQMASRYVAAARQNQEDGIRYKRARNGAPRPAQRYQLHDPHHQAYQASQMQHLSPVNGRPYMQCLEMPDPAPAAKRQKVPGCTIRVSGVQAGWATAQLEALIEDSAKIGSGSMALPAERPPASPRLEF